MSTILKQIKKGKAKAFRKLYIKRRLASTGLFESDWQELTSDVKRWGKVVKSIDSVRYARVRFSDLQLVVANDYGRYNPETDSSSFWFGYANQQRSLVKVEAGFTHQTLGADGIYYNTNLPSDPTVFVGVLQGDLVLSDSNEVALTIKPLTQIFRDYSCRNLNGITATGMTAKNFLTTLRDQTDGAGSYVFRPFFQDTTTNWELTSSSIVYEDLINTIVSNQPAPAGEEEQNDFLELTVWDAIERLAEAENMVPFVTRAGAFRFNTRAAPTSAAAFEFYGRGHFNYDYGLTVKSIDSYVRKTSDYYGRVELKWSSQATTTAVVTTQTSLQVGGSNTAWLYGHRSFRFDNYWLATLTSAQSLAQTVFSYVSSVPDEVKFTTSFVPHLDVLDLCQMNYDSTEAKENQRWDLNDWASSTAAVNDLIWANPEGDALRFNEKEFKITAISLDLDKLESKFTGIAS